MTRTPDEKRRALRDRFWASAQERVSEMNLAWTAYEQRQDMDALRSFVRHLHTLKGESRMLGYSHAGDLMHSIEDAVGSPGGERANISQQVGDLVLEGLDWALKLLSQQTEALPPAVQEYRRALRRAIDLDQASDRPVAADALRETDSPGEWPARRVQGAVRVSWEKLERMRDAIADLMLTRIRLTRSVDELGKVRHRRRAWLPTGDPERAYRELLELVEGVELRLRSEDFELERLVAQLEVSSRDLRLVPISTLFDRYPSAVRRMARELGRKVELKIVAEPIEVDRVVIESLYEPVLHLVRNAIDHGIEPPEVRQALGKSESGTVVLAAEIRGESLTLQVIDDGAGISVEDIREVAVKNGMFSAEKASQLGHEQWMSVLFLPAFTTLGTATMSSGRGIGLDVVKTRMEEVGGSVQVHSEAELGTRFVLEAPVTIAINTVVLMRVGLGTYAIPASSVVSVVPADAHPPEETDTGVFIMYNDRRVPVVSMEAYLDETAVELPDGGARLLILQDGGVCVALAGVRGQVEREVVVKSAAAFLGPTSPCRAVVALEDGTLGLVLKLGDLVAHAMGSWTPENRKSGRSQMPHALVVDDSPIVRQLVGETLKSRGLKVSEASDGTEAFEMLRQDTTIGILLTDIHMPEMSGLELIRNVRTILTHQPKIIVISLRGTEVERAKAFEAGADDYLVKTDISQRRLWDLVSRYL